MASQLNAIKRSVQQMYPIHHTMGYFERKRIELDQQQQYNRLYQQSIRTWYNITYEYINQLVSNYVLLKPMDLHDTSVTQSMNQLQTTVVDHDKVLPVASCYLHTGVTPTYNNTQHKRLPFEYCVPAPSVHHKQSNIVTVSRDFFYLGYCNEILINLSNHNLQYIVLPLAVHYLNSSIRSINKRSHHLICSLLIQLKKNYINPTGMEPVALHTQHIFYQWLHQFSIWFITHSLHNYNDVCTFESLAENYVCVYNVIHDTTDHTTQHIPLYLLQQLINRCIQCTTNDMNSATFQLALNQPDNNNLTSVSISSNKSDSQLTKSTSSIILLSIQLLQLISVDQLSYALDIIEQLMIAYRSNTVMQHTIMELINSVLKNSFDLYRRDQCVVWYFTMCDRYHIV